MKHLLRSCILVELTDDPEEFLFNYDTLTTIEPVFAVEEDENLWTWVQSTINDRRGTSLPESRCVPSIAELRKLFDLNPEILDRLHRLALLKPLTGAAFEQHLSQVLEHRDTYRVLRLTREMHDIARTGLELRSADGTIRKLKGARAAIAYAFEVVPTITNRPDFKPHPQPSRRQLHRYRYGNDYQAEMLLRTIDAVVLACTRAECFVPVVWHVESRRVGRAGDRDVVFLMRLGQEHVIATASIDCFSTDRFLSASGQSVIWTWDLRDIDAGKCTPWMAEPKMRAAVEEVLVPYVRQWITENYPVEHSWDGGDGVPKSNEFVRNCIVKNLGADPAAEGNGLYPESRGGPPVDLGD